MSKQSIKAFAPMGGSETLKHRACKLIADAISKGTLKPGERINESWLAQQLHISRAPIREALHQLQERGLIVNVPWRGMFVATLRKLDVERINSVRLILESEALRLARIHLTHSGEQRLARLLRAIEKSNDAFQKSQIDLEFHRTIWELAGNDVLEHLLSSLLAPFYALRQLTVFTKFKGKKFLSHRPLLDFVRGRSSQSAEETMMAHLANRPGDPVRFSSYARDAEKSLATSHKEPVRSSGPRRKDA